MSLTGSSRCLVPFVSKIIFPLHTSPKSANYYNSYPSRTCHRLSCSRISAHNMKNFPNLSQRDPKSYVSSSINTVHRVSGKPWMRSNLNEDFEAGTSFRACKLRHEMLDCPRTSGSTSVANPSTNPVGLSKYCVSLSTSGAVANEKNDDVLPSKLSTLSIDTNNCDTLPLASTSNTSAHSPSESVLPGNHLPLVFRTAPTNSTIVHRQSLSDQSSPELSNSACTSNSSNNSSSPRWSNAITGIPSASGSAKATLMTDPRNGGLVGLNNLGNTCFMNSIVQCLSNTQPLLEYCLSNKYASDLNKSSSMRGTLFASYVSLMRELWNPDLFESSTNPYQFKTQVQRFAPRFVGYSQQDSQEFLRYLLEGLHMEVNRVTKRPHPVAPDYEKEDRLADLEKAELYWSRYLSMDNSAIVDLFVGQLMSTLECADCGFKSTTFDPFWDLSLPIPKKPNVNIMDCLRLFTSKDDLDGNERPVCGRCKLRRRCAKSFSIQKFPPILVLHLKRFSGERFRSKMSVLVDYPVNNLDLIEFSSPSCPQKYARYNLYAVSNHSGSVYAGHYTATCKHHGRGSWFEYNDSRVRSVNSQSAVSPEGYVLFYELAS